MCRVNGVKHNIKLPKPNHLLKKTLTVIETDCDLKVQAPVTLHIYYKPDVHLCNSHSNTVNRGSKEYYQS